MPLYRHIFQRPSGETKAIDAQADRACHARDAARNNLQVLVDDPSAWKLISQTLVETT